MQGGKTTWFGHIKQMLCIGIISVIIGVLMLTLVFCLPVDIGRQHVAASVDEIIRDVAEIPNRRLEQYIFEKREIYTDAIMVQNAIEAIQDKNPYEHAMWAYHMDLNDTFWTPEASVKYLSGGGDTSVMSLQQYSRYWHGYLVYLKPLLLLFTWERILWIGAALQVVLMLSVLIVSFKKGYPQVGIAMLVGLLFMKPVLMLVSLAMTVCWLLTLAVMLVILLGHDWLERKEHYPELFLLTGILVAYFDFLTYPVVTLGFPLCAYFLIKSEGKWKENLAEMISYSACWGLGYAAMWAMKWILADLTLHTGTIKSAVSSIVGWTEAIGGRPRFSGGFYVILLNMQEYAWWLYPVLAALLVLFDVAAFVYACRMTSAKRATACCIPYLIIACIPFVWYIVVQHHSGLHTAFTFRIISVACLALGSIGLGLLWLGKKESASDKR